MLKNSASRLKCAMDLVTKSWIFGFGCSPAEAISRRCGPTCCLLGVTGSTSLDRSLNWALAMSWAWSCWRVKSCLLKGVMWYSDIFNYIQLYFYFMLFFFSLVLWLDLLVWNVASWDLRFISAVRRRLKPLADREGKSVEEYEQDMAETLGKWQLQVLIIVVGIEKQHDLRTVSLNFGTLRCVLLELVSRLPVAKRRSPPVRSGASRGFEKWQEESGEGPFIAWNEKTPWTHVF